MNDLRAEIREIFDQKTSGVRPRPLPRSALVRAKARRIATGLGSAAVVATLATIGYATVSIQLETPSPASGNTAEGESRFADLQSGRQVASGTHGGARWALGADRREFRSSESSESLLCVQMDFGDVAGDPTCNSAWNAPPTAGFVAPIWYETSRGPIVIYGSTQEVVETIEITVNGHPAPARVYEAPADFASTLDFFVGFVPPGSDVAHLVARDAAGNELESRDLGPGTREP